MTDDQGSCEWVNVSSGTGYSQIKGQKTVVVSVRCDKFTFVILMLKYS